MRRSNSVYVVLFHKHKVSSHLLIRSIISRVRIAVMTIYTLELHRPAVYLNNALIHLYISEANLLADNLVACIDSKPVKIRCFSTPKLDVL